MPAQEKIRVMIVDDITDTRENIRRLLQFDPAIEVVGAARTGREAIDLAPQIKPDVIIMDINMPDMDGITATEAIRRILPWAQVIILSVQSDPSYMRRAMLAGARDFLSKPPMIDELTAAIRRAALMASEEKEKTTQTVVASVAAAGNLTVQALMPTLGKIIVVYSPKGGTGKTTIATNLAVALQSEETKTLLVDANVQFGDVAVFLNEQIKNSVLDLTPRVDELDQEVVDNVVLKHQATGLNILAAPSRPEMAIKVASDAFGKVLQYLRQSYSYIVVDTASYLTDVVQAALDPADLIILVTTPEFPSIKNASEFLQLADASEIKRNRILFIMNKVDKNSSFSPERVGERLRQEVVIAIPNDEKIVSNSINRGIPFVAENKTLPISKAVLQLADLVRNKISQSQDMKMEFPGKR